MNIIDLVTMLILILIFYVFYIKFGEKCIYHVKNFDILKHIR